MDDAIDVYSFALQSKKDNTSSIILFSVGVFTAGGVYGLTELSKRNKGLSQIGERAGIILLSSLSFGIGVPFIIAGFMKTKSLKPTSTMLLRHI